MNHGAPHGSKTLGADLRALRKSRKLTLVGVADLLGKSVGWLSQVERDISQPSIDDLRRMADVFDVSVSSLFHIHSAAGEEGFVVRSDARRPIGSRQAGLVEELLSPDLTDDFEMIHSTFAPLSQIDRAVCRPTQEVAYVVSGQLHLTINGRKFHVKAGDSFRIRGESYTWNNPYETPCVAIWVIAPPVY